MHNLLKEWWQARPRLTHVRHAPRRDLAIVLALAIGAAAAVGLVAQQPLVYDAINQLEMAGSLVETGELRTSGELSRFYPPLYPLVLVLPGQMLGFDKDTVHLVQAALFGLLVASAYFVASAFDRRVGLVAALLCAANPVLLAEAGEGRATLLSALLLLWTFHFVSTGLSDPRRLGWAGLCAGLLYLTKDTTGYIAIVGISIGLLWRVRAMGVGSMFASKHYLLAGALFGILYGAWAARNAFRFGSIVSNPGLADYSSNFFFHTGAGEAATLVVGATALFILHWLGWIWPVIVDMRTWAVGPGRLRAAMGSPRMQALLLFVAVACALAGLMAAIFIRNDGTKSFPGSMPDFYRLAAAADPILVTGVGILVFAKARPAGPKRAERLLALGKVAAVAGLMLAAWPSVASHAEESAEGYRELGRYLRSNGIEVCYSEAAGLFAVNLPRYDWRPLHVDFSGPWLNHSAAGMPGGAALVTVGWSDEADFRAAGFSVFLHYNASDPPAVTNPFYKP